MRKEELTGKEPLGAWFSLSFCGIIFRVSCWLIQRITQLRIKRVPWVFTLPRTPWSCSCVQSKFWFRWGVWPLGVASPLPYRMTPSHVLPFETLRSSWCCGSSRTLGSWCCQGCVQMGQVARHVLCVRSSAHVHAPVSHQITGAKHNNKDKILKNFKNSSRALNLMFNNIKSCAAATQITCPWRPPWKHSETSPSSVWVGELCSWMLIRFDSLSKAWKYIPSTKFHWYMNQDPLRKEAAYMHDSRRHGSFKRPEIR